MASDDLALVMTLSDDEEGPASADDIDADDDFGFTAAAAAAAATVALGKKAAAGAAAKAKKASKAKRDKGGSSGASESSEVVGGIADDLVADVDGAHGKAGAGAALLETGVGLSYKHLLLEAKLRARAAELAPVDEPEMDELEEEEEGGAKGIKEVKLGKKAREAAAAKEEKTKAKTKAKGKAAAEGDEAEGEEAAEGGATKKAKGVETERVTISGAKANGLTHVAATTFKEIGLSLPLLKAIQELGFAAPTPIQAAVIPAALRGIDICGSAVTGSGELAFTRYSCTSTLL